MNFQIILHNIGRIVFVAASAIIVLAFVELIAQFAGTSVLRNWYSPGRLIELGSSLLVLAIAITLREIRDELRSKRP